ncbi:MAG: D-alanine--D-alanine ligase [Lachnospiraceae bacterium]|nr:D-alanine--D-alanine ligase [Lachnospiraceae bacterium]MBD5482304.1 D-alanine--D-alanine ligase [Lachnospiraceae bacterium]
MDKLKIAVLFGGCSEEHDVSVKSASEIAKEIDPTKYEPFYIGITRDGKWLACEKPCAEWEKGDCFPAVISPDRGVHGLTFVKDGSYQTLYIDVVFPVLHGKTGEDGAIQGLLELSGIPYIGCDIASSALCMDKSLAYMAVKNTGIAVPEFRIVHPDAHTSNGNSCPTDCTPSGHLFPVDCTDDAASRITVQDLPAYPVFVKPARSGSSFGVSKVHDQGELHAAMKTALQYDDKILIEEAVIGTEVGCAVLEKNNALVVGEIDQITLSHGFFRIHQENAPESGSENASFTVPADLPQEKQDELKETAKAIYRTLGCRGLARVDMFLRKDGSILLNEVNTLPGFTSYSRYPRMMKAAGISVSEVIDSLISTALQKETNKS